MITFDCCIYHRYNRRNRCQALLNRRDLRITISLRVARILYKNQDIEVMVPGLPRAHNGGIIGPGAVDFIEGFKII